MFAYPLGGLECRGHVQYPIFAPGSSKVAFWVGFFFLLFVCLFVSFGSRICPNCTCMQLVLVPYSFFVFCSSRKGMSMCKHHSTAAKGPKS